MKGHASREQWVEALRRGEEVEVDLDEFARNDDGGCMCALCICVRRNIEEYPVERTRERVERDLSPYGTGLLSVPPELRKKLR